MRTRSEISSANRTNGLRAQTKAAKTLNIGAKFRGQMGNEESWGTCDDIPGIRWEVKSGRMPKLLEKAFDQVLQTRSIGSLWKPGVLIHQDGDQVFAVLHAKDLVDICRALAEVGQGSKIRTLTRQARRALEEIEGLT